MGPASRVACVRIPRFPIGAVWLDRNDTDLHWDTLPLALTEGTLVRAASATAAQVGVRVGMTLAQARAKCATLVPLTWDTRLIARETARASAAFLAASPQVAPERGAPGTWWVGADGFDGVGGERILAESLLAMARVWHPRARVAIADSCVTAYAATWSARAAGSPLHIAPGGDGEYLARVPTTLVPMELELREALTALGLRTAGAFARLDPLEVERRWGSTGLASWRLARGDDARRATLSRTDDPRAITHDLATSSSSMEPVLFLVRAALDRLVHTLAAEGRAVAAVAITLTLEWPDDVSLAGQGALPTTLLPGRRITREMRPARPIARAAPLFERCRALLDTWTLDAPIRAVEVRISDSSPSAAEQGDLLAPTWRDPAAAEAALARLRATLGRDAVVRPVRRDSHAPERAGAWEEVEQSELRVPTLDVVTRNGGAHNGAHDAAMPAPAVPAARLLESPEPITITTDKRGTPLLMFWRGRRVALERAHGPERLSGEWWQAEPFAREYWRCESDELGQDLLLYRNGDGWRLQGWYD